MRDLETTGTDDDQGLPIRRYALSKLRSLLCGLAPTGANARINGGVRHGGLGYHFSAIRLDLYRVLFTFTSEPVNGDNVVQLGFCVNTDNGQLLRRFTHDAAIVEAFVSGIELEN